MRAAAVAVAIVALATVTGCSKSPTPGAVSTTTATGKSLPFDGSPSQAVLAEAADLSFPESVAGYRSVRVSNDELDVSFTIAAADLQPFVTGSHLGTLTANKRVINHPSPVWDLNPTGSVQSTVSERHGVQRAIEVVVSDTNPTTDTVRLLVAPS